MALNDVRFVTTAGGLGRLPAEKDYVSGLFMALADTPGNWDLPLGKKYLSLAEAESDGIVEGDADFGLAWYFIREFFRKAGPAELYVVDVSDASFTAQNVYALTNGDMRQVAWYAAVANAGIAAHVGTVKTFTTAMEALKAPLFVVTNVKDESTAVNGTSQTDLSTLDAETVSVLISGDNSGKGLALTEDLGIKYVPALGAVLGQMAKTKVGHSIGWVAQSDLSGSGELTDTIFYDAKAYNAIADSVKDTLQTKRYLFLRRYPGQNGTYVNLDLNCTSATSDLARIRNVRTIQKAKRLQYAALLPQLQSPLTLNADGTLTADTVKFFENLASRPLERMVSAGEISAFSVTIDPSQNVLSTGILNVQVKIVPLGAAETITVTIGFETSL